MIPFTQYLRPDGHAVLVHVERPADVEQDAKRILDHGWRFEAEVLTTGEVSFTIVGEVDGEERDVVIRIGANDATVADMVDGIVADGIRLIAEGSS